MRGEAETSATPTSLKRGTSLSHGAPTMAHAAKAPPVFFSSVNKDRAGKWQSSLALVKLPSELDSNAVCEDSA